MKNIFCNRTMSPDFCLNDNNHHDIGTTFILYFQTQPEDTFGG